MITKQIKVGILTDTAVIDKLIVQVLAEKKRYHYTIFSSTTHNISEKIVDHNIDCLFLKINLKNMDAIKLCSDIKNNISLKHVKLIFLSSEDKVAEMVIQYGASSFLKLPIKTVEINKVLDQLFIDPKTILYVDDTKLYHDSVVPKLQRKGYAVHSSYDGVEGWEYLQDHPIDLVITDVAMPHMNGYQLCKKIKRHPTLKDIVVIMTTTLNTDEHIIKGFSVGVNAYLTKPFKMSELISRVNNFLIDVRLTRKEKILIVESDPIVANSIQRTLRGNHLYSEIVQNGRIALNKLSTEEFFLVITALELPICDGLKLVTEIKQDTNLDAIPIIVLCASQNISNMIKMQSLGIQNFLYKPFNYDRLLVEVEKNIAETKLEKEHLFMQHYLTKEAIEAVETGAISGKHKVSVANLFRTILFIDIEKFTPLCEKLSAREVVEMLNIYFDIMVGVLVKYGGSIDKFIGDAIMALFSDEAVGAYRAVYAAKEMIGSLEKVYQKTGKKIHMRIGINSGYVILGDIGSRYLRRDHTAIGDNVNIASRLESNAGRDEVLISEATYKMVKKYVDVTEKELSLKGKEGLFKAFRVNDVDSSPESNKNFLLNNAS